MDPFTLKELLLRIEHLIPDLIAYVPEGEEPTADSLVTLVARGTPDAGAGRDSVSPRRSRHQGRPRYLVEVARWPESDHR